MYSGIARLVDQTDGLDDFMGLLVDNLNGLLHLGLRMFGLIRPEVVALRMGTDEQPGTIGLHFVAYLPCLIFVPGRVVTPDRDLANTQMSGAADRTALLVHPVCTGTRMRQLVDVDQRFQFLGFGIHHDHFVRGVGGYLEVAAGWIVETIMQELGGIHLGNLQVVEVGIVDLPHLTQLLHRNQPTRLVGGVVDGRDAGLVDIFAVHIDAA